MRDPQGPFLCRPKIFDIRSDITTRALEEHGWAITVDEQEESFKIQDLERKIFTPERNRVMCQAFFKHAQRDPAGALGKSIIFAVNQTHATNITRMLNELQPESAVTITSRIPEASVIAKDFRDGKRKEPIAVSVDMLSTGYNCRDLLNVVLMRPIFSPTEYIQIKGRGTRRYTFRVGSTEYDKKFFFLLDFCGVAEYFEEQYDYSLPLPLPRPKTRESPPGGTGVAEVGGGYTTSPASDGAGGIQPGPPAPPDVAAAPSIPTWTGRDAVISEEVRLPGPGGEKVDLMTFRGSFERDLAAFARRDAELTAAVDVEDDDAVETILNERFLHQPEMFYSTEKLVLSYGVPAPTPAFAYDALGKRKLPTKEQLVDDTVDSLAARFNLRYNDQRWLRTTVDLLADNPSALRKFLAGDMIIFRAGQFNALGGLFALSRFAERSAVFEALRQTPLVPSSSARALVAMRTRTATMTC